MSARSPGTALGAALDAGVIVCPRCHGRLGPAATGLVCAACARSYAVEDGAAILFDPRSVFYNPSPGDARGAHFTGPGEPGWQRRLRRALPALADDRQAAAFDRRLGRMLAHENPRRGLVVGAGERPAEMARRLPGVDWLVSDVDGGYGADLLADVQWLPIADGSLDVVVAEMVLEHVMEPWRAAAELERVLAIGGLLLIKTPFCFPWHGIPFDFYRPTPSGLLALFPAFEVLALESGMGPWGALAYTADAALTHATGIRPLRRASVVLSRLLLGWLKLLDRLPRASERRLVSAGGLSFLGRKQERRRAPRETWDELRRRFGRGP